MKKMLLGAMLLMGISAIAQTPEETKAQMIKDWQRAKTYTQQYLDAMPADKYSYKANDSTRSFAEQMLHLAQGNVGLIANGTGAERIWVGRNLERSTAAGSKDSVSYYVNASYDYAIKSLQGMDASKLGEKFKRGNFEEYRSAWIQKAFEHQTHHRGQTTIYIRLLGIRPPAELLF